MRRVTQEMAMSFCLSLLNQEYNQSLSDTVLYQELAIVSRRLANAESKDLFLLTSLAVDEECYTLLEAISKVLPQRCWYLLGRSDFVSDLVRYKPKITVTGQRKYCFELLSDLLSEGEVSLASKYLERGEAFRHLVKLMERGQNQDSMKYLLDVIDSRHFNRSPSVNSIVPELLLRNPTDESLDKIANKIGGIPHRFDVIDTILKTKTIADLDKLEKIFSKLGVQLRDYYGDCIRGLPVVDGQLCREIISRTPSEKLNTKDVMYLLSRYDVRFIKEYIGEDIKEYLELLEELYFYICREAEREYSGTILQWIDSVIPQNKEERRSRALDIARYILHSYLITGEPFSPGIGAMYYTSDRRQWRDHGNGKRYYY
jgi:hypothetical protein